MSLILTPAVPADAADIVALRDALAQWMIDGGIDQWRPGEYPLELVLDEIARGEWHILRDGPAAAIVATVRVAENDAEFWGDDVADAGYIHGLMVSRDWQRAGAGRDVVAYAEGVIRGIGKPVARLDTATTNTVLMAYYPSLGYERVRETKLPLRFGRDMSVTLFQKRLS